MAALDILYTNEHTALDLSTLENLDRLDNGCSSDKPLGYCLDTFKEYFKERLNYGGNVRERLCLSLQVLL